MLKMVKVEGFNNYKNVHYTGSERTKVGFEAGVAGSCPLGD